MKTTTTKRKASSNNNDFKKIRKAKVGRKARAPANVTDTSFKAASIRVASSRMDTDSGNASGEGADANEPLVSGRGKTVDELLDKLRHHPAPAARLSSAKGLRDVLTRARTSSSSSSSSLISSHLSTLLPVVVWAALMDEDDDVRTCGLDVLRLLLLNNKTKEGAAAANEEEREAMHARWRPFLPLLRAHIGSALNSMNRSTRMNGARAVTYLAGDTGGEAGASASSPLPLPLPFTSALASSASSILPALVRLLKEQSHSVVVAAATATATDTATGAPTKAAAAATSSPSVSRKKVAGALTKLEKRRHHETMTVLRALRVVLRDAAGEDTTAQGGTTQHFVPATNHSYDIANPWSIRIVTTAASSATNSQEPTLLLRNVADWSRRVRQCSSRSNGSGPPSASYSSTKRFEGATVADLMEGLRDVLLDGLGTDMSEASGSGGRTATEYDDEILETVSTILPLAVPLVDNRTISVQEGTRIRKALAMILSSLVQHLPDPEQPSHHREAPTVSLPAQVCLAVLAVANAYSQPALAKRPTPRDNRATAPLAASGTSAAADKALATVVEFTVNAMRGSEQRIVQEPWNQSADPHAASVLWVLERLLESDPPAATAVATAAHKERLLRAFVASFFSSTDDKSVERPAKPINNHDMGNRDAESGFGVREGWSRSAAVRRAVLLAHRIVFVPNQYQLAEFRNDPSDVGGSRKDAVRDRYWAARKVLRCIPSLVVSWRDDFVTDSLTALVLLHEVVRSVRAVPERGSATELGSTDDVHAYISAALAPILEPEEQNGGFMSSTFELYPEKLQRLALGIFALSGRLPTSAVRAFGKLCSRSHLGQHQPALKPRMAEAVMEAVHSIRRQMSMRDYLSFVLKATGALDIQHAEQQQSGPAQRQSESSLNTRLPMGQAIQLDRSLQIACRLLVQCGPVPKLLSMLWPFLLSFLLESQGCTMHESLLKTRTACTLLAFLLQYSDEDLAASAIRDRLDALSQSVARFTTCSFAAAQDDVPHLKTFLRPAICLMSIQSLDLLPSIFQSAFVSSTLGASSHVQALCYLSSSSELQDVVGYCVEELLQVTRSHGQSLPPKDGTVGDTGEKTSAPAQIWLDRLLVDLETVRSQREASTLCHPKESAIGRCLH